VVVLRLFLRRGRPRLAPTSSAKHDRHPADRYCEVEEETGFAFRKGLPLAEVRAALDRGEEPGEVRSWEMA
jgi:hypothetical protein